MGCLLWGRRGALGVHFDHHVDRIATLVRCAHHRMQPITGKHACRPCLEAVGEEGWEEAQQSGGRRIQASSARQRNSSGWYWEENMPSGHTAVQPHGSIGWSLRAHTHRSVIASWDFQEFSRYRSASGLLRVCSWLPESSASAAALWLLPEPVQ